MKNEGEKVNHLLVIDDNPGDVRFIEEAFENSSLSPTIYSVTTADEAVAFMQQQDEYSTTPVPDVVLLDCNLPKTTGEEVLDSLRAIYADLPVVLLTNSEFGKAAVDSSELQADLIRQKPTTPQEYIEMIQSLQASD